MKIVYDGHIFRWQKTGGISRYFFEIISRLPATWKPALLGFETGKGTLPSHPRLEVSALSAIRPRRLTQPIKKAWWKVRHLGEANVFHPTYYNLTGGLNYSEIPCPIVLTVHDFVKAIYSRLEGDAVEAVRDQSTAILHASHLICVSKSTERDLLLRHPETEGKTSVIYHGSSFPICTETAGNGIFEDPTFLYVGRRESYKNFLLLLRAFTKACKAHQGIRLHVAGPAFSNDERWQMHFLGISDRVDSTVFPDENALQRLYQSSVALLYPSRHEGFGMPPLEAMACGTVAITSNVTSLPEVVGDAGILLDPADEDAWTECILQVASGKIPRAELLKKGRQRVGLFSWERSAQQHADIYRRFA